MLTCHHGLHLDCHLTRRKPWNVLSVPFKKNRRIIRSRYFVICNFRIWYTKYIRNMERRYRRLIPIKQWPSLMRRLGTPAASTRLPNCSHPSCPRNPVDWNHPVYVSYNGCTAMRSSALWQTHSERNCSTWLLSARQVALAVSELCGLVNWPPRSIRRPRAPSAHDLIASIS